MSNSRSKFQTIVSFARRRIHSGTWKPGTRAPSENELSEQFSVSRMTARRALDQLALDGLIFRRRGSGSYIADGNVRSSFLVIRNIAEEVAESGRAYSNRVLKHRAVACDAEVGAALDLRMRARVFHSLIVHLADEEPVQLEDRYVRPDAAPLYLQVDLTAETPNQYLQRLCPLVRACQEITAALPDRRQRVALAVKAREPCLLITRVTEARVGLVSFARILAPASRYRLSGQLHFSGPIVDFRATPVR
jgi:GntR family histidine utilization transcriptional repressor